MKNTIEKVTQSLENWLDNESVKIQPNLLQEHFTLADQEESSFESLKMESQPATLVNHNEVLDTDRLPNIILSGLRNYYEFVFLFESFRSSSTWYLSEFSIRGQLHKLNLSEQVSAKNLVPPKMTELDVFRISTKKFLQHFDVTSEKIDEDDSSFLIHPTHNVAVVMSSRLPELWASPQVERTQKLVNKAFSF